MFLGTGNKLFNFFDNPYIEVNVYDLTEEFKPKISKDVKLRKCEP